MIDPLALIMGFFLICFLVLIILVGISFLYWLFNVKPSEATHAYDTKDSDKEIEEDSLEDSNGDGLMLFDDPMFPPEFDDEEE